MEKAPRSIRYSISIVGRTNAGKSALINALCEQEVAIVSPIAGTTTDSVTKAYELTGFGPVMFYDTAGLDDKTELGEKRIEATLKTLKNSDMALVVIGDGKKKQEDEDIIAKIESYKIPYIVVYNKLDIYASDLEEVEQGKDKSFKVSSTTKEQVPELKEYIKVNIDKKKDNSILEGLVYKKDIILLVAPIDSAAPAGRLILPQVLVTREILDKEGIVILVQPEELLEGLAMNPKLVITDSQALHKIIDKIPQEIALTTFSILMGRNKGDYDLFIKGARAIDKLSDGDKVLIAEACSHTTTADDIAREQLPKLLEKYTGKKLQFEFAQGRHFPQNLESFALVVHCGSCMLTQKETLNRIYECRDKGISITNYGMTFGKCQNMLERTIEIFEKR